MKMKKKIIHNQMIKNQTIKKYEELLNKQRNDFISKLNN